MIKYSKIVLNVGNPVNVKSSDLNYNKHIIILFYTMGIGL